MNSRELIRRLHFLLHKRRYERDLQEEMLLHHELRAHQLAHDGVPDAAAAASRVFGNHTLLKERANDMWGWRWLEDAIQDLRHTGRMFASNPGFAAIAVLTLALGIGANTAIFSATNALLMRGLPVQNPEQIFRLSCDGQPALASGTGNPKTSFSDYVFQHLRRPDSVLSDLMAYVPLGYNKVSIRTGTLPEEAAVDLVSGNFFSGLGVRSLCGRMLSMQDERAHSAAAVVSYGFAVRRFGNACAGVGRPLTIKGVPFTIVGVAARSFSGVESTATDLWIPFQVHPELNAWGASGKLYSADPDWWCILMIARLRPGVAKAGAEVALNTAFQHAAYEPDGGKPAPGEKPTRLHLTEARGIAGGKDLRRPLMILQVMVGFLLLIACGNLSMLLAVRNAARAREFSLRLALGGSKWRLFRQLLTESSALVFFGALVGLILAQPATRVLARWAELDISLAPDRTVLGFALIVAGVAGLVFGVAPGIGAARISIANALKTTAATAYRQRSRISGGNLIAVLQLALCLALLAGTGLLVRTLQKLENLDVGFRTSGLLVFGLSPHVHGDAQEIAFYRSLTDKLRSLPRVESLTVLGNRIGSGWSNNTLPYVDGDSPQDHSTGMDRLLRWNGVGPDFFRTLGIRMIAGRDFTDADSADAPLIAVVNQTFANKFFHGRSALGHTVSYSSQKQFTTWASPQTTNTGA